MNMYIYFSFSFEMEFKFFYSKLILYKKKKMEELENYYKILNKIKSMKILIFKCLTLKIYSNLSNLELV